MSAASSPMGTHSFDRLQSPQATLTEATSRSLLPDAMPGAPPLSTHD